MGDAISKISLGDLIVTVDRKAIKNIHLSVYPPDGRVHLSAPERFTLDQLRVYAIGRLSWIKRQRRELRAQPREPERQFVDRESHYFRGQRYLLEVTEKEARPRVQCRGNKLWMSVRPGTDHPGRKAVLDDFYRAHLKTEVARLIAHYEPMMAVSVADFRIQRMRTKWGSCNVEARRLRFNLELARKPPECLEFLVVHEMVHLLERRHTARFRALMDRFMPGWEGVRRLLNALPVAHVDWDY